MDREISQDVRRKRVAKQTAVALIAIAAVVFALAATVHWLRPSVRRNRLQLATVERGSIEATLNANGTVIPNFEQVISSPVEARVLRIAKRAGETVKQGDELLVLDTAAASLDAQRLGDVVTQKESERMQLALRLDETLAQLRSQLEQKKLDAQILHYTSEQRARLRSEGLIAEQDALSAAAAAKKSDIEIAQLEQAVDRAVRSRAAQLEAAEKDLAIARRAHDESRRQLELAGLRADRDGILTWVVPEVGATVRRGDIVARIADLSSYRVEATISDVHAARLSAGMPARLRLDGASIDGVIESVDPRIVEGVVKFHVRLDQPSDTRLRNNLRADVSVISGRKTNTLVVRRGALGRSAAQYAFVLRGDAAVRVPVRYGLAGDTGIEILEGLREGDQVVISDMTDFEDIREVRIE
jgi:HlyD family secretion protein